MARRRANSSPRKQTSRQLAPSSPIDPSVRRTIEKTLARIERQHQVRILLAVESGSRAWGFPSPDSDYDVRFLYVHAVDWYLALDQRRDVIEMPISRDLDINGWDLRKALQLLCRSNATLGEWLVSPIVYREDPIAARQLRRLASIAIKRKAATWHYLRLGQRQFERELSSGPTIRLKKYFYALRPALALAWLRSKPDRQLPMSLQALIGGLRLPADLAREIETLVRHKAITKEMGEGPRIAALDEFIRHEYSRAAQWLNSFSDKPAPAFEAANKVFQRLVHR